MSEENSKDEDFDLHEVSDKTSIIPSDTFKVRLAQADQAPPCLILLVGPANYVGRQWPIQDTDRVIGRADSSHVCVADGSISKSHAKLVMAGGDVSIIDLESTNKTVVNGRVLQPLSPLKLENNDQIKMGNVIFKYLEKGNIEAVSVAQTYDRSQIDPLTEIYNRGALMAKGTEFYRQSELLGAPLSVIVFDVDNFKKVNDNFGHSAGDYVLKEISRLVRETLIRGNDFFARYGGEEFCLLLLGGSINHARDVAERIRITIESHTFAFQGEKIPVTISLGVASKQEGDEAWTNAFDRGDQALYQSKNSGKNKVSVS